MLGHSISIKLDLSTIVSAHKHRVDKVITQSLEVTVRRYDDLSLSIERSGQLIINR